MDLTSLLALLRRHIRVSLAGLVLTLGTCAIVAVTVPLTQSVTGSIVLLSPALTQAEAQAAGQLAAQNPMLTFSDALRVSANLIVQVIGSPEYAKLLAKQGATAKFTVSTSSDGTVPLVSVTAKSDSASSSLRTAQIVLQAARDELSRRQAAAGAPPSTLIQTELAVVPSTATSSWRTRVQYMLEAGLIVVLDTFIVALALDWVELRRSRRLAQAFTKDHGTFNPLSPANPVAGRRRSSARDRRTTPARDAGSAVAEVVPGQTRGRSQTPAAPSPSSESLEPRSERTPAARASAGRRLADTSAGTDRTPGRGDPASR